MNNKCIDWRLEEVRIIIQTGLRQSPLSGGVNSGALNKKGDALACQVRRKVNNMNAWVNNLLFGDDGDFPPGIITNALSCHLRITS